MRITVDVYTDQSYLLEVKFWSHDNMYMIDFIVNGKEVDEFPDSTCILDRVSKTHHRKLFDCDRQIAPAGVDDPATAKFENTWWLVDIHPQSRKQNS